MKEIFTRQNLLRFGFESALIVFSLLLALLLNEYRNEYNEQKQTERYLDKLQEELISNKRIIEEVIPYHKKVLLNFQAAAESDSVRNEIYNEGKINLFKLAPEGLIQEFPSYVAWEIIKQSGLIRNLDFDLMFQLSATYKQQEVVMDETIKKLSDKIYDPTINSIDYQHETLYFFMIATNELYTQELALLYQIESALTKMQHGEK